MLKRKQKPALEKVGDKTTLGEIFSKLKSNRAEIIVSRESEPDEKVFAYKEKYPYLEKSIVEFYTSEPVSGFLEAEQKNLFHRPDDSPAQVVRQRKKTLFEAYYLNGELHRDEERGPAVSDYTLDIFEWRKSGELHRISGPAYQQTDPENLYDEWWCEGQLHRDGGPAIEHYRTGLNQYYSHGEYLKGPDETLNDFNIL